MFIRIYPRFVAVLQLPFLGFTARVEDGDQPLSIRVVGYWILFILLGAAGARVSRWNEQALEHGGRSIPPSSLAPPLAPHARPLRLRENVHLKTCIPSIFSWRSHPWG